METYANASAKQKLIAQMSLSTALAYPKISHQDKYVADILKKFDFATVKSTSTPIETNKALLKDEETEDVDVHLYRSMIGSLMYLTTSRPDVMFAVCACARDSPFDLEAFLDSAYAGASLDRKSTTGGCQFLGKRLISWQCKNQTIVANSITEAEDVAAANCCGQVDTSPRKRISKKRTKNEAENDKTGHLNGKAEKTGSPVKQKA
ncbi:hypothetical protein Tco_1505850 [Tanacetum coccineum]